MELISARLLPHLEQGSAFNSINFTFAYSAAVNTTIGQLMLTSLICPSEVRAEPKPSGTSRYGVANYNWNVGDWYVFSVATPSGTPSPKANAAALPVVIFNFAMSAWPAS